MIRLKETIYFLIASAVIGYLFAFKQLMIGKFLPWLSYGVLAFIMIFLNAFACEIAMTRFGCDAEYRLWGTRRVSLILKGIFPFWRHKEYFKREIPLWLIWPLIFIFATWGYVRWLAVLVFEAVPIHVARIKAGRIYAELTEWDLALIATIGPLVNVLLAIVSKFLTGDIFEIFATMNIWYALFNLLPLSDFNGAKIFYGSKMLWAFLFVFTVAILILLGITNVVTTLIAAGVLGLIAVVFMYLWFEKKY